MEPLAALLPPLFFIFQLRSYGPVSPVAMEIKKWVGLKFEVDLLHPGVGVESVVLLSAVCLCSFLRAVCRQ